MSEVHPSADHLEQIARVWDEDGFVILPGYIPPSDLAPAIAELPQLYPSAADYHGQVDPQRNRRFDDEFGGIDDFPFSSLALNLLAVHPKLTHLAERLLRTPDLRAYSIEAWAKYTGAADYDQHLHRDYLGASLVAPSSDLRYSQVEMFLYLCDVPPELGPPALVPLRYTTDMPMIPNWFPNSNGHRDPDKPTWISATGRADLYEHEIVAAGPAGTIAAYTNRTFHRATQLTASRGARYTLHVNYRPTGSEWQSRHSWLRHANTDRWQSFVEHASPRQLALFGWPPPGHPYWTADTLAAVHQRYPALDLEPWKENRGNSGGGDPHPTGPRDGLSSALAREIPDFVGGPRMTGDVKDVEVVVAHNERTTLRVGDVFLKIDADQKRTDVEVAGMAMAPVPTPEILWRKPPVLALAAVPGTALGRLQEPSPASPAAWIAAGVAIRKLHDAPLPPWPGRSLDELASRLDSECEWLVANNVLPADVVTRNRRLAETALRPWTPAFTHGDLQITHVFVDGDTITGIIDWSEASQGDALYDLATLTLAHEEHLDNVLAGYGTYIDRNLIRAWWSWRCLTAVRWLVEHGFGPLEEMPEIAVLRSHP